LFVKLQITNLHSRGDSLTKSKAIPLASGYYPLGWVLLWRGFPNRLLSASCQCGRGKKPKHLDSA